MSAILVSPFNMDGVSYTDPSNAERFFTFAEHDELEKFKPREFPPSAPCQSNLFFGFFHDGTRNNYGKALKDKNRAHSNIARLYSCYPGRSVPKIVANEPEWEHEPDKFKNYFRVYTPGVGSVFESVGDSGEGAHKTLGAAMAYKGEPRITWTLLQAINNLHRYFKNKDDAMLVSDTEAQSLYQHIRLNKFSLEDMTAVTPSEKFGAARSHFESILRKLHEAIQFNMPDPKTGKPNNPDPGCVQQIYVSVFGFSRGAAAARVFANWLVALCRLDAMLLKKSVPTLGGFPVTFDFLGLFDTVASVGLANTANTADGHWGWADAEVSMRVPSEFSECLHLVSAHEVRRSFPLDSISVAGSLVGKRQEIVYPGVHSDIGGGYFPKEQGKGKDETGMDMLSRLPLAHMYRAARLAGVPLKLDLVKQESVKDDFRIAPQTIAAFNHYLRYAKCTSGTLTEIMREQRNFYIFWRYHRRSLGPAPLEGNKEKGIVPIDSYEAARQVDKNDLHSANHEFTKEIEIYERWREEFLNPRPLKARYSGGNNGPRTPEGIKPQPPGFGNDWYKEWEEITRFWGREFLPQGMAAFFDDYVHDSRAWFKLIGPEADDVETELQSWIAEINDYQAKKRDGDPKAVCRLTKQQYDWAMEYRRTGEVPHMINGGREPAFAGAGYLRYRKIYAGGDRLLISQEGTAPSETRMAFAPDKTVEAA